MAMDEKELYLLSVKECGIAEDTYFKLKEKEKKMLAKKGGRYYLRRDWRRKFKVALTGGTFDILHVGHVLTLSEAKRLADVLVVIIATDKTVERLKGKRPIHSAEYRASMVSALKPVDLAIIGGEDFAATFRRVQPDIVVFGYDQKPFDLPSRCKIVHLAHIKSDPSFAKTSRIIRDLGI